MKRRKKKLSASYLANHGGERGIQLGNAAAMILDCAGRDQGGRLRTLIRSGEHRFVCGGGYRVLRKR